MRDYYYLLNLCQRYVDCNSLIDYSELLKKQLFCRKIDKKLEVFKKALRY